VLTVERARKFSQRAREYIQAYHTLHEKSQEREDQQQHTTGTTTTYNITLDKIHLIKDFKTHRCTLDFDNGFIKATMISS
jgi:hypothetical protein